MTDNQLVPTETPHWMMQAIAQQLPADTIERLGVAYREQERFKAERAFTASMTACQEEMPAIVRNKANEQTNSRYANLEGVNEVITPIYTKHGFSLSFGTADSSIKDYIRIKCDVRHEAGHKETHFVDLPPDAAGIKGSVNKTGVHAAGSTLSYGRRYLTLMIFNLATTDDNDGNSQGGDLIDEEQLGELTALWSDALRAGCKLNMDAVCKWLGVARFADLDQGGYKKAASELRAKIAARGK